MRPIPKGTTIQRTRSVTFALVTAANNVFRRCLFVRRVSVRVIFRSLDRDHVSRGCRGSILSERLNQKRLLLPRWHVSTSHDSLKFRASFSSPNMATLTRIITIEKGVRIQCIHGGTLTLLTPTNSFSPRCLFVRRVSVRVIPAY